MEANKFVAADRAFSLLAPRLSKETDKDVALAYFRGLYATTEAVRHLRNFCSAHTYTPDRCAFVLSGVLFGCCSLLTLKKKLCRFDNLNGQTFHFVFIVMTMTVRGNLGSRKGEEPQAVG